MLGVHSLAPVKLYAGTTTAKTTRRVNASASKDDDDDESPMAEQVQDAPARGMPESVAHGALPQGPTTAGLSQPLSQTLPPSSTSNPEMVVPSPQPDETHVNAITYRRDPETVIAYLVALPPPTVQGKALAVPIKYFLYAPPPPHLVKPAHGGSEGYAVRLTRHWQQSVRRAKSNAHNGKAVSWRGVRSKGVRAVIWGLNKLKYDDVAFLARVHPRTVTHLILIHPASQDDDLSGSAQTPEELLATFRAQIFASKRRAKRNSIISAALFLPALAIDTAAVFFGGLAEIDGIWMLVSITAYRTARLITQKMGPDPKTLQISHEKLIEDAQRDNTPPYKKQESDDESDTGAIRKSVDALRRGVGSVKQRMSLQKRRKAPGRKSEGGDRPATDDASRPQTHASQGLVGSGLGDHAEEAEDPPSVTPNATDHESGEQEELSGMLEHGVEEEEEGEAHADTSARRPTGGILQGDSVGEGMSTASEDEPAIKNKGQNFQLTFYPSPAMDILDRYMRQSCHLRNNQAFTDPTVPPTEAEVLAVMGWRPERRQHQTPEQQQEDEQWQAREAEDDLRLVAAKAAKSWDKACRQEAKRAKRPMAGASGSAKGVRFLRPRASSKGKATTQPCPDGGEQRGREEKRSGLKQRLGGMRRHNKSDRKKQGENTTRNDHSKAAGAAALLCIPCVAVSQRVKRRKNGQGGEEEVREEKAKRPSLKDRLVARKAAAASKTNRDVPDQTTTNKSRGGLVGGMAAVLASLKGVSRRKKQRKNNNKPEEAAEARKKNQTKFSALIQRVKALRTRVMKRVVRGLGHKRTHSKATSGEQSSPDRDVQSAKMHSAIVVGLVAGCFAMPGAKVKQLREKRRASRGGGGGEEATMPVPPPSSSMSEQPPTTTTTPSITLTPQPPIPIPEQDGPAPCETQYLPGHGQSEIPVSPSPYSAEEDEIRNHELSDERHAAAAPSSSSSSAVKLKSFRNGMSNFTTRTPRRHHVNNTAADTEGLAQPAPSSPLAPLGVARFRFALENLRASRGGHDDPGSSSVGHTAAEQEEGAHHAHPLDAGIEGVTAVGDPESTTAAEPTKPKFGNLGFIKRKGGEKPVVAQDKVYKDGRNSGVVDRIRAIWYTS